MCGVGTPRVHGIGVGDRLLVHALWLAGPMNVSFLVTTRKKDRTLADAVGCVWVSRATVNAPFRLVR